MMQFIGTLVTSAFLIVFTACGQEKSSSSISQVQSSEGNNGEKIVKSDEDWKSLLSEEEYEVLRRKGTEMAFTGDYNFHKEKGIYVCAGCGNELFSSKSKYNSGSGWPSFFQPLSDQSVGLEIDESLGMTRKEIICNKCDGHLGHVFEDGPKPTGMRYCVNSVSLEFKKE